MIHDTSTSRHVPPTGVAGVVYYTDNALDSEIASLCRNQLKQSFGGELVSVSLQPIAFGRNVAVPLERSYLTMFKQILAGLEVSVSDIVFFCEHDVLYHPTHFTFRPSSPDVIYYNTHVWKVRWQDGHALRVRNCRQTSGLCADRATLVEHYRKRVALVEKNGFSRRMGFEPGTHGRAERVDDLRSQTWQSAYSNLDIRHATNLTPSRWRKDQFRNRRFTQDWTEARIDDIPGWELAGDANHRHPRTASFSASAGRADTGDRR